MLKPFIPGNRAPQDTALIYAKDLPQDKANLFALSEFALLDISAGLETAGTEDVLRELLLCLINQALAPDVAKMQAAHAENNWDKVQQLAHKIKGGALYVGTIRLKMACQYLERYWKTGQTEFLPQLYQQALTVIHDTVIEVRVWLK